MKNKKKLSIKDLKKTKGGRMADSSEYGGGEGGSDECNTGKEAARKWAGQKTKDEMIE